MYVYNASRGQLSRACKDLLDGVIRVRLWSYLGVKDVRDRYRGAVMGASWIILTTALLAVGLSFIYGTVFGIPVREYLPYVTVGLAVWGLISSIINESAGVFVSHSAYFNQIPVPLSVFIYRMLLRNLIILGYRLVVIVGVLFYLRIEPSWIQIQSLCGVLIIAMWGTGLCLVLGPVCARFRDVGQAIGAVTTFSFFVTPVFWYPEKLSQYAWVVDYNVLYHLLELVRGPVLGQPISEFSLGIGLMLAVLTNMLGLIMFMFTKQRIPYWCQ